MSVSFIVSITPQAGTVLGGESPPPPPPPPLAAAAPNVLIYNHQVLFECSPTHAAASAGFRILSTSDHLAPMVLISDTWMEMGLAKYFDKDNDAYPGYKYPDTVLMAAKDFKKHQREEADAHPKFAKFFDNVERLCMKVQETYLADPDTY